MGGIDYAAAGFDYSLLAGGTATQTQVNELQAEVLDSNNNDFKTVFSPSLDSSTSAINTGRLVGRNATLSDLSQQLMNQNTLTQKSYEQAKDTYTRQGEINEWQAQNKLDTLFFLQILFVFFSIVVILLYLRQATFIGSSTVYGTVGILLLIVIGILWNRVSYTNMSRDSRYWNRRYIAANPNELSSGKCSS
jgi:NADH:ubiquinone oxidoreductase subunit 3 (subunit A)